MKNKISFVSTLIISFLLVSTAWAQKETDTRNLSSFSKVKISGAFKVYLEEGNKEKVKIETQGIDPDEIETEVDGDVLKIKPKEKNWKYNSSRVSIYLTYNNINSIHSSGASDIVTNSVVKTNSFEVRGSGSGDMKLKVDVADLVISLSGSNDIEIEGKTKTQSIAIAGSGDIDAFELDSDNTTIKISGSGDVDVSVNESLTAKISGSGEINYKGSPGRQDVKVSGSGSVRKANK